MTARIAAKTSFNRFAFGTALALMALLPGPAAADDLTLPDYSPKQQVTGVIRSAGNPEMAALLKTWQDGFRKIQPDVRFTQSLTGTGAAMYNLDMRTADIVLMGRQINPYERYGTYERSWVYPIEVEVATGSERQPHKSPAFAIFVHKDNPLEKLDLIQLDRIFGAERGGGWKALSWDLTAARPASTNVRTWGQLGLDGALSQQPIHVYGPPNQGPGAVTFFQAKVLGGGGMWNETLREYPDRRQMLDDLSRDPLGIAYAPIGFANDGVKALALAATPAGPFVALTKQSVAERRYLLARPVYVYFTIDTEKSEIADPRVEPTIDEFLHYIVSRQGQADVAREGSYLPLPAVVGHEQLKIIESTQSPPERDVLE